MEAEQTVDKVEPKEVPSEIVQEAPKEAPKEEPKELSPRELAEQALEPKEEVKEESSPEPAKETPPKQDEKTPDETSIPEQIKAKIQKRIDKVTARAKTAEERVAELEAENERLRKGEIKPEVAQDPKREPTDAEIRAALIKAKQDGDVEFEVQIIEFMADRKAKAERLAAEKQFEERQSKQTQATAQQQKDWVDLNRDYESKNTELNLANQQGTLYKTAMALFMDKELQASHYNDPNRIMAFRRAVADAHREIMENNLLGNRNPGNETNGRSEEPSSKSEARKRTQLAEPSSEVSEETTPSSSKVESEADVIANEIKRRKKFQEERFTR
jgi:hypothetical protein